MESPFAESPVARVDVENGSPDVSRPTRPSWVEHCFAALITVVILEQHSRLPEAGVFAIFLTAPVMLVLVITWFVRLLRVGVSHPTPSRTSEQSAWHWAVLPVAILILMSSSITHWPATVRFYCSKSSFEQLVTQAQNGKPLPGFPRRVGLYWIDEIQDDEFDYQTGQGNIGFITGVAVIDQCGLYYDPADPESSHYLTIRIAPCWYVTEW